VTFAGAKETSMMRRAHTSIGALLNKEEGADLIEFALSISVLMTMVLGIIAMSLAVYSYFFVSDAAREATRYAMVRGQTLTTDCTAPGYASCIAQPADIQTYVRGMGFPGINANNLTVTSTWLTSGGGACGTADSCKTPGNQVKVTVSYPFPLSIPFLRKGTINMASTSVMVIAQ
jgi:Flp pilus assembly protein TadG